MAKKLYDYDEIMDYLNTGKTMDQSIQALAKDIRSLCDKVKECEVAFHGKGDKTICKAYQALYKSIGCSKYEYHGGPSYGFYGDGMWRDLAAAISVCNTCYTNAERQKQNDEGDMPMQSFSNF